MLADPQVLAKVRRICDAYRADPSAQRHHFWKHYVESVSRPEQADAGAAA